MTWSILQNNDTQLGPGSCGMRPAASVKPSYIPTFLDQHTTLSNTPINDIFDGSSSLGSPPSAMNLRTITESVKTQLLNTMKSRSEISDKLMGELSSKSKGRAELNSGSKLKRPTNTSAVLVKDADAGGMLVNDAVVETVVEIADRQGTPSIGLAVQRLYDASRNDPELAAILDAVLRRNPTPEQYARWAKEVKRHRRDIKREGKSAKEKSAG